MFRIYHAKVTLKTSVFLLFNTCILGADQKECSLWERGQRQRDSKSMRSCTLLKGDVAIAVAVLVS